MCVCCNFVVYCLTRTVPVVCGGFRRRIRFVFGFTFVSFTATLAEITQQEDALLMQLVAEHGNKNWRFIATYLPGRLAKQCRERWFNQYVPPTVCFSPFGLREVGRQR